MANRARQNGTGTAGEGVRPGDYAVGSPQSRAAARAALEHRLAARKRLQVIFHRDCNVPVFGQWTESADGTLYRSCFLPEGMTPEEAERFVSQPGWTPTIPPAKPERIRPPLKPEW